MRQPGRLAFLLPALIALLATAALAQTGPVQLVSEANMKVAGTTGCGAYPAAMMSRETGRTLTCVADTWTEINGAGAGEYSVLSYGATCGGSGQEVFINAAIDAASVAGGGVVKVPCDCILKTGASIVLKSDVDIYGECGSTSTIKRAWEAANWLEPVFVTSDLDATPTKQDNWRVLNLNLTYDATGCSAAECDGGMFAVYGDGWLIQGITGDWYGNAGIFAAGDNWRIHGNRMRQELTTGLVGDDCVRVIAGTKGLVSDNSCKSYDDCYDGNFGDTGTVLVEQAVSDIGWFNNQCEGGRMFTCVVQEDSNGTGSCRNQTIDGLFGSARLSCISVNDQAEPLADCVGAGSPYACCDGVGTGTCTNLAYNDQLSGIHFISVHGACNGDGNDDATSRAVIIGGADRVTISDSSFSGCNDDCISIDEFTDVSLINVEWDATTINGADGAYAEPVIGCRTGDGLRVIGNNILMPAGNSNASAGIQIGTGGLACDNATLVGNQIKVGQNGVGMRFDGGDYATVVGNHIDELLGETGTVGMNFTSSSTFWMLGANDLAGTDTPLSGHSTHASGSWVMQGGDDETRIVDGSGLESPRLNVSSAGSSGVSYIDLSNSVTSNARIGEIRFLNSGDDVAAIIAQRNTANDAGRLEFWTQNTGGSLSFRGRFDRDGVFEIGDDLEFIGSSFATTVSATDPSAARTLTLPDESGTIVTSASCSSSVSTTFDPTETDATTEFATFGTSLAGTGATHASQAEWVAPRAAKLIGMTAGVSIGPGGGKTRTFTITTQGGDSPITCSIADAAVNCTDSSNTLTLAAGDTVTVKHVTSCTSGCAVTSRAVVTVCTSAAD